MTLVGLMLFESASEERSSCSRLFVVLEESMLANGSAGLLCESIAACVFSIGLHISLGTLVDTAAKALCAVIAMGGS